MSGSIEGLGRLELSIFLSSFHTGIFLNSALEGSGGMSDTNSVILSLAIELVAIKWHEGGHLFTKDVHVLFEGPKRE
jgi:hypothetical protein